MRLVDSITILLLCSVVTVAVFLASYFTRKPSHDRDWTPDQKVLPSISTYGNVVTVHNIRNATYKNVDTYTVDYYSKTFKRTDIQKLWLALEPFGPELPFGLQAAHVFVSFELLDGSFVSISVEIRKKKGDYFTNRRAINGILRYYELMYVVADEKDVIQLRTNHRKDDVFLYPLRVDEEIVQNIFFAFAEEINELLEKPSFFHTITDNCTTILIRNLRKNGISFPRWHISYLFPSFIDALFYKRNLIDTTLSKEEARNFFHITEKAQNHNGSPHFSNDIRK